MLKLEDGQNGPEFVRIEQIYTFKGKAIREDGSIRKDRWRTFFELRILDKPGGRSAETGKLHLRITNKTVFKKEKYILENATLANVRPDPKIRNVLVYLS